MTPTQSGREAPVSALVLLGLFAASLHVLVTIEIGGSPLRAGASDLLLPILGLLLGIAWWRRRLPAPRWFVPHLNVWLLAMLVWLGVSVWRGWGDADMARSWAALKWVGFLALLGYFLVGGLLVSLWGRPAVAWACRWFVRAAWVVAAYALIRYFAASYGFAPSPWYPRLMGFAENPNAFGLLAAGALLLQLACAREYRFAAPAWRMIGATLLLAAVVLAASRSVYIGLCLALAVLAWRRRLPVRESLQAAVLAVLLLATALVLVPRLLQSDLDREKPRDVYILDREYIDLGVSSRLELARHAIGMWLDQPISGGGIGSFMRSRQAAYPDVAATTNHSTLLWWMSEMGLVGVVVFGGFLLLAVRGLSARAPDDALAAGVLGVSLLMVGASVGMEVMYQRFAWMFLGMALVSPAGDEAVAAT